VAVNYPEFGDFCEVAARILGTTPEQIARLPNVGLAESALAAPRAGFGDVEVYPTLHEKAAILRALEPGGVAVLPADTPLLLRGPLLDIDAVAEALGVTSRHVQRLVSERRIPFLKVGRFVRFDPGVLNVWLDQ